MSAFEGDVTLGGPARDRPLTALPSVPTRTVHHPHDEARNRRQRKRGEKYQDEQKSGVHLTLPPFDRPKHETPDRIESDHKQQICCRAFPEELRQQERKIDVRCREPEKQDCENASYKT